MAVQADIDVLVFVVLPMVFAVFQSLLFRQQNHDCRGSADCGLSPSLAFW
jgi:hypothetical protein